MTYGYTKYEEVLQDHNEGEVSHVAGVAPTFHFIIITYALISLIQSFEGTNLIKFSKATLY